MKKGLKVFYTATGVLLFLAGLLLAVSGVKAGWVFVALGLFFFCYPRFFKKKEPSALPDPGAASASPSPAQVPAPKPAEKVENFRVAGISNYTKSVEALAEENPDYNLSKAELKEDGPSDERIFQYYFTPKKVELVPEPENEYDSNAVMVIVDGEKIGYIKKGSCSHVKNLLASDKILRIEAEIGGGNYKYFDSEENSLDKSSLNYWAEISIHSKPDE